MGFALNAFQMIQIAGFADQHPQLSAIRGQCLRHMMAYKTGRACKKDFHH
jgi:hypothetical protein